MDLSKQMVVRAVTVTCLFAGLFGLVMSAYFTLFVALMSGVVVVPIATAVVSMTLVTFGLFGLRRIGLENEVALRAASGSLPKRVA